MIKDEMMRKSVIASVIASVVVMLCIKPLLNIFWSFLLWLTENVSEGVSNSIYRSAALGDREYVSVIVLILMISIPTGMAILLLISLKVLNIILGKEFEDDSEKIDGIILKLSKIAKSIYAICIVLLLPTVIFLLLTVFADLQLNTSFNQRLTVLSPKLTDQEIKEFRASWASMGNRTDFENLNGMLESTAKKYSVKLPKQLLK